jgi:hypothetical protein
MSNFAHSSPKSPTKSFRHDSDSYHLYILSWAAMNLYLFHLIFTRLIAHAKLSNFFPLKRLKVHYVEVEKNSITFNKSLIKRKSKDSGLGSEMISLGFCQQNNSNAYYLSLQL